MMRILIAIALLPTLAHAQAAAVAPLAPAGLPASAFPPASRPVAPVVSDQWRDEDSRERVGEATRVLQWLGIKPGMTVADIGAGSGYYTTRLSAAVGPQGRVLAEDIMPNYLAALARRTAPLGNVSVGLGEPGDPRLPPRSVDIALMVHMYHEIEAPYALLGNLLPALRPGARIAILDVDDAIERHGTPQARLMCELAAAGYKSTAFHWVLEAPPRSEYLAIFEPPASPIAPGTIKPCP